MGGKGNLEKVELEIEDICESWLGGLGVDGRGWLLGKLDKNVCGEDLGLGLMEMVLEWMGEGGVV